MQPVFLLPTRSAMAAPRACRAQKFALRRRGHEGHMAASAVAAAAAAATAPGTGALCAGSAIASAIGASSMGTGCRLSAYDAGAGASGMRPSTMHTPSTGIPGSASRASGCPGARPSRDMRMRTAGCASSALTGAGRTSTEPRRPTGGRAPWGRAPLAAASSRSASSS